MLYSLWYSYRQVDYSRSHRLFWLSFAGRNCGAVPWSVAESMIDCACMVRVTSQSLYNTPLSPLDELVVLFIIHLDSIMIYGVCSGHFAYTLALGAVVLRLEEVFDEWHQTQERDFLTH